MKIVIVVKIVPSGEKINNMAAEASRANQRYNLLYFSSKPGLKAAIEPRH